MSLINKKHIFVSYSQEDHDYVSRLVSDIKKFGIDVWMDRDRIVAGDKISSEVKNAIKRSKSFLLVISDNSSVSNWVHWELDYARVCKLNIVPVIMQGTQNQTLTDDVKDIACIDLRNTSYNHGLNMTMRSINRKPSRIPLLLKISLLIVFFVIVGIIGANYFSLDETKRIEEAQKRIELLDRSMNMNRIIFWPRVNNQNREVLYYRDFQRDTIAGKDVFDTTDNRLISRSYYDEVGRRIAIDRFEWRADVVFKYRTHYDPNGDEFLRESFTNRSGEDIVIRKRRTHFDIKGNEFIRESFSRTGKLEKKEYDKYGNGNFIEHEADFVTTFPVVVFPVYYR